MERSTSFYTIDTIQSLLHHFNTPKSIVEITKKFALLMEKRNVIAKLELLTSNISNGILPLDDKTLSLIKQKHPTSVHPVVFEDIDGSMVKEAALETKGDSASKKSVCRYH